MKRKHESISFTEIGPDIPIFDAKTGERCGFISAIDAWRYEQGVAQKESSDK